MKIDKNEGNRRGQGFIFAGKTAGTKFPKITSYGMSMTGTMRVSSKSSGCDPKLGPNAIAWCRY